MRFYTVSELDETFDTIREARQAWIDAGRPQSAGNSVWVSEHDTNTKGVPGLCVTVRTITLSPCRSMTRDYRKEIQPCEKTL